MSDIRDLLSSIDLTALVLYIFLGLFAFKGAVEVVEYFYNRIKNFFETKNRDKTSDHRLLDDVELIKVNIKTINDEISHLDDSIKELLELRLEDIRFYLKSIHHEYVSLGAIDDNTLQNAEEKYQFYIENGGNGYTKTIFEDIRNLRVVTPSQLVKLRQQRKEESTDD